jgi:ribonuclease T2
MPRLFAIVFAALVAAVMALPAAAQRGEPYGASPREQNPSIRDRRGADRPGQFDYYVLALSWSPSYCAGLDRDRYDPQCHSRDGKRFAFVLHGLWPQFERGWPQDCETPDRGFVPRPVATRMLDIMPTDKLVFHQYRKHGTCSGLGVDGYFALARRLYEKVRIPERFRNVTDQRLFVAPKDLMAEFMDANPGLEPDAMAVQCGGPGNRLREVRICFTRDGQFRTCGRNEDQGKLCSAASMYVPPVRSGAPGANTNDPPAASPSLRERLWRSIPGAGQRI